MGASSRDGAGPQFPLAAAAWLRGAALQRVLACLEEGGTPARIVGGAVRNALLGEPITDIDIATPLLPEDVMVRANAAGIAAHPTGIEHGTVTLATAGEAFEVTTLRRDVETDGRRAVVAFSSDWREDAARRDFTINALYATPDGAVFDYFGGLEDLAARRLRFIGAPEDRIREDYLRILRFFRFTARYGEGAPEPHGLAACIALKDGLARLSGERVGAEMMKLMAAPRAAEVVAVMARASILTAIIGPAAHPDRLEKLRRIEAHHALGSDPITRLAVLALDEPADASPLALRLRLSRAEETALAAAAAHRDPAFSPLATEAQARAHLYRTGADNFHRAALVSWAASDASADDEARFRRATLPQRWTPPHLPMRGADVLALGVPAGPKVGQVLQAFEQWWISADFPADSAVHMAKLAALANQQLPKA